MFSDAANDQMTKIASQKTVIGGPIFRAIYLARFPGRPGI
jgi:hypothetical protein